MNRFEIETIAAVPTEVIFRVNGGAIKVAHKFYKFHKIIRPKDTRQKFGNSITSTFPPVNDTNEVWGGGKIVNYSLWWSTLYFSVVENSS